MTKQMRAVRILLLFLCEPESRKRKQLLDPRGRVSEDAFNPVLEILLRIVSQAQAGAGADERVEDLCPQFTAFGTLKSRQVCWALRGLCSCICLQCGADSSISRRETRNWSIHSRSNRLLNGRDLYFAAGM